MGGIVFLIDPAWWDVGPTPRFAAWNSALLQGEPKASSSEIAANQGALGFLSNLSEGVLSFHRIVMNLLRNIAEGQSLAFKDNEIGELIRGESYRFHPLLAGDITLPTLQAFLTRQGITGLQHQNFVLRLLAQYWSQASQKEPTYVQTVDATIGLNAQVSGMFSRFIFQLLALSGRTIKSGQSHIEFVDYAADSPNKTVRFSLHSSLMDWNTTTGESRKVGSAQADLMIDLKDFTVRMENFQISVDDDAVASQLKSALQKMRFQPYQTLSDGSGSKSYYWISPIDVPMKSLAIRRIRQSVSEHVAFRLDNVLLDYQKIHLHVQLPSRAMSQNLDWNNFFQPLIGSDSEKQHRQCIWKNAIYSVMQDRGALGAFSRLLHPYLRENQCRRIEPALKNARIFLIARPDGSCHFKIQDKMVLRYLTDEKVEVTNFANFTFEGDLVYDGRGGTVVKNLLFRSKILVDDAFLQSAINDSRVIAWLKKTQNSPVHFSRLLSMTVWKVQLSFSDEPVLLPELPRQLMDAEACFQTIDDFIKRNQKFNLLQRQVLRQLFIKHLLNEDLWKSGFPCISQTCLFQKLYMQFLLTRENFLRQSLKEKVAVQNKSQDELTQEGVMSHEMAAVTTERIVLQENPKCETSAMKSFMMKVNPGPHIDLSWDVAGDCEFVIRVPIIWEGQVDPSRPIEHFSGGTIVYQGKIHIEPNGSVKVESPKSYYEKPEDFDYLSLNFFSNRTLTQGLTAALSEQASSMEQLAGTDISLFYQNIENPIQGYDPKLTTTWADVALPSEVTGSWIQDYTVTVALSGDTQVKVKRDDISRVSSSSREKVAPLVYRIQLDPKVGGEKIRYFKASCTRKNKRHQAHDFDIRSTQNSETLFATLWLMKRMGYTSLDIKDLSNRQEGEGLSSKQRAWLAAVSVENLMSTEGDRPLGSFPVSNGPKTEEEQKQAAQSLVDTWLEKRLISIREKSVISEKIGSILPERLLELNPA